MIQYPTGLVCAGIYPHIHLRSNNSIVRLKMCFVYINLYVTKANCILILDMYDLPETTFITHQASY